MRRRTSLVTALAATALLAAGCGLTDDGPRPGAAAEVDGQTLELDKVDSAVEDYCGLLAGEEGAPSYAKAVVRSQLAWNWAQAVAVDELAPRYGVDVPSGVESAVVERSWGVSREDDEFESFEWLTWIGQRLDQPLAAIGTQAQIDAGQTPTAEGAQAAGYEVVDAWLEEHGVELNPVFGERDAKQGAFLGDDLSVAVSGVAKQGDQLGKPVASEAEATERLSALPASEVCGAPVEAPAQPVG
ncbi:hypothetical protein CFH99_07185 [Nocardioides aromaticivorans]|uniref:Lipoprotein n=1 Tax=Nocardioides aromaticivorans TaxID=200618 RepID=A0ABX7PHY6_9ACTN|nr:hypothetical protein [Nocardioides aromaticivorans]QSR25407.1 hypothetical protein CFH99_07185 [Nocardioides aromaticivorans]